MYELYFTLVCLLIGALSGFLGGLLGIGGGVIIVPALILSFEQLGIFDAQGHLITLMAVGTSLSCIIFTSLSAAITQLRAGMVEWPVVKRWALFLTAGSYLSGFIAAELPGSILRALIAGFLLFVAGVMLTSWKPSAHRNLPGRAISAVLASLGGIISGLAGIGGGNIVVPTLVYFNTPIHRATATSSTLGLPIALAGTLGYVQRGWAETQGEPWALGYVYVPAFAIIISATVLFAPLGVRTAHHTSPLPLRRAFGGLLILVSLRMFYSAFA